MSDLLAALPPSLHTPAGVAGMAGLLVNLVWPLLRQRAALLAGQVTACALMLTHFALLGAPTGALVMLVAGIQAALAIPLGRAAPFRRLYLASLPLTPAVCLLTWHGLPSLFSSLALALVCLGNYQLQAVRQRALLLAAIAAWAAHNLLVDSLPGLLSNALAGTLSSLMLWRELHRPVGTTPH